MFGFANRSKKSQMTAIAVAGIVGMGALIPVATQAIAQIAPAAPVVPAPPDEFSLPSRIGVPLTPSVIAPVRPPVVPRQRRIPIEPVPMPGDARPPLAPLPATPDIRMMPDSDSSMISGVSGKVVLTPICSVTAASSTCLARPYTGALKVSTASRDRVIRLNADEQGLFRLRLTPGTYVIEPDAPNFRIGAGQTFTVISSMMRDIEFNFQGTIAP